MGGVIGGERGRGGGDWSVLACCCLSHASPSPPTQTVTHPNNCQQHHTPHQTFTSNATHLVVVQVDPHVVVKDVLPLLVLAPHEEAARVVGRLVHVIHRDGGRGQVVDDPVVAVPLVDRLLQAGGLLPVGGGGVVQD
jgi:hypothetical protein